MPWSDSPWLEQAKECVARALCAALGLAWDSDEALAMIRYAWAEDAVSHAPDRFTHVIYVDVGTAPDPSSDWETVEWRGDGTAVSRKIIPLQVNLTCYGPRCAEIGEYVRTRFLLDTGWGSPRSILRGGCLVFSGKPERLAVVNEPDGAMWRRRVDVRMRLNLLHEDVHAYSEAAEVPLFDLRPAGGHENPLPPGVLPVPDAYVNRGVLFLPSGDRAAGGTLHINRKTD